jgi:hypothetical protein
MKTIHNLIAGSIMLLMVSCASEFDVIGDDVPPAVLTAFEAKYPDATAAEWNVEKSDGRLVYEAEFKIDNKKKKAEFESDGTFIKGE